MQRIVQLFETDCAELSAAGPILLVF